MLIVVAIIAILIAVSIPLINNALNKAKHATDAANERAAKAEILLQYMGDNGTTIKTNQNYYYNAATGALEDSWTGNITKYGKHNGSAGATTKHEGCVIAVRVDTDGKVYMKWTDATITNALDSSTSGYLCSAQEKADHS